MSSKHSKLRAPFSYFGGKSRAAPIVWQGLGEVSNYIEPFCGSLAVLLANSKVPKIETVNDVDHLLCNFWRAVSNNPEEVAKLADFPVMQVELHAKHRCLLEKLTDDFKNKMENDPNYYDVECASMWIYGQSCSIGNNWLQPKGLNAAPLLSSAGGGINGLTLPILDWFRQLQQRLRRVRVACGDWKKIITPSISYNNKGLSTKDITGIFCDPPYSQEGRDKVYRKDEDVFQEVCRWAEDNGDNAKLRIAVCGYEGDYNFSDSWQKHNWKAEGGMSALGDSRGKDNAKRETIWFSPHCLKLPTI